MTEYILEDICFISSGGTPKRSNESFFYPPTIPWVKVGDLGKEIFISETEESISKEGLASIGNRTFPTGTVLLAMYGATLGKTGIADIELSANQAILGINSLDEKILSNIYLKYWLDFNVEMFQFKGKGGTYKNLSKKFISNQKILLPEINQQHAIVRRFEKIQVLIQKRNQSIDLLDEYINSVFLEMFGDPVINEKGWSTKKLENLVEHNITYGVVKSGEHIENGIPFVRAVDLGNQFIDKEKLKNISNEISKQFERTILSGDELLLGIRGKTGAISLVTKELKNGNVARGIVPLRFSSLAARNFYYHAFIQKNFQTQFNRMQKGMAIKGLNLIDLKALETIDVDLNLIEKFYDITNTIFFQKEQLLKSKELLEELFQSLIYQTFSPEKEEEIDEIQELINDELLIREFFETIDKSDFQSLEQYDVEIEKLRKVLKRTQKESDDNEQFNKGIVQILNDKKIQLRINKDYINEKLDEATEA